MDSNLREQVRKWLRQGKLGRVVYTCDQQLHSGPLPPEERAEWLYMKAKAHSDSGAAGYGPAKACLKEGIPLARKSPNLQGKMMATLSALYVLTSDAPASEALLAQFRKLARAHPSQVQPLAPCLLFNTGITYDNFNRPELALRYYKEAAEAVTSSGLDPSLGDPQEFLGMILHNLGGAELKLGNLEAARTAMEQANARLADDLGGHKKLSRLAQYHLAAGNLHEAQQFVTAALVHEKVDDYTRADVYITWAKILRRMDRPAEAREKAMTGLDYAVRVPHYPAIHELNQLLKELAV